MTKGQIVLIETIRGTQLPPIILTKRRPIRLLDKNIAILFAVSFALLLTKFLAEGIVEALIK